MSSPRLQLPLRRHIVGEPYVWFTAMGLAVGLLMVVLLLGLIVANGLAVFWPQRVEQVTLVNGSAAGIRGSLTFSGEAVTRVEKTDPGQRGRYVVQYHVGNRDAYELGFVRLDESEIASRSFPEDVLVIERLEYGDAIASPVRLETKEGQPLLPADAAFRPALDRLISEAAARRAEILDIQREKIGTINRTMAGYRVERKRAERTGDLQRIPEIDASMVERQAEYEQLAAQAKELLARQEEAHLVVQLATGEERTLPIGLITDVYAANQLGFGARCARFAHNIWAFVSENPREANTEGGIFPAIFGTLVMTLMMSLAVVPFGVVAAIYLREYAKQGAWVRAVRIAVNNLAGVPSIVFGVFGLGFFVYTLGGGIDWLFYRDAEGPVFRTGGLMWAAATLALMTVPVVIVATEEAIAAVPRGMKEGSLACGASKWQTIQRIVLPASAPGIITGMILAMARGAGEVAPLMLVGVVKMAPTLPIDGIWKDTDIIPMVHLDQKFMHLGFHIYDLGFQSPDSDAARPMVFATTLLLIVLIVVLNLTAILLRERLRRKYRSSTF